MAKWSEKHMYNWTGWMDSVANTYTKINEWTVTPTSPFGFLVFTLNITLGSLLLGLILGLMLFPQTIEWIIRSISDEVDRIDTIKDKGIKKHIKEFTYVMLAIFVLIPYAITWGLPKLIMEHRENKRLKRAQELERHRTEVNEDRRRWTYVESGRWTYPVGDVEILWSYAKPKRDFRPKMELKAHRMVEPRTISTGNYSIAIGYGNVARGNHSISPWPSDVTLTTHTEGGVSTAMVTHNNINNEGYRLQ